MPPAGAGIGAASSAGSSFNWSGLGDIASGIGGLVDTIFGGDSDEKSNKLAKKQLEFMMRMSQAGQEDALGNKMYYDSKTNSWKVKLNNTSRATQVASDEEELRRLTHDLPQQRTENDRSSMARSEDAGIADTLRRRILNQRQITPQDLEGELYDAKARGIRETTDSLGSQLATQGLRTGVNPKRSLDEISRTQSRQLSDASSDARLEAITGADDVNNRRTGSAIDQYGAMASRASNTNNVPFNPASLTSGLEAISAGRQSALGGVANAGRTAVATTSVPSSYYGKLGTAAGGLGDALAGILSSTSKKPTNPTVGNTTY